MWRFYVVDVQPDLFGQVVIRIWPGLPMRLRSRINDQCPWQKRASCAFQEPHGNRAAPCYDRSEKRAAADWQAARVRFP
jgi:hypothetical protein